MEWSGKGSQTTKALCEVRTRGHAMTHELSTLPDEQGGVFGEREKIICSTSSSQQAIAKQVANMAAVD
ncbi:hypothetical protein HBI46_141150 [Parastagonospora nodorum]|nr:hypothetical protein HBI46_141150 [Parastagonospora nodorum]